MTASGTPAATRPTHELKVWRMYFEELNSGVKSFEYRKDDRTPRFEVGDVLRLREWGGYGMDYSGRECFRRVTYIARGGPIIPEGFCIMSLVPAAASLSETPAPLPAGQRCEKCGNAWKDHVPYDTWGRPMLGSFDSSMCPPKLPRGTPEGTTPDEDTLRELAALPECFPIRDRLLRAAQSLQSSRETVARLEHELREAKLRLLRAGTRLADELVAADESRRSLTERAEAEEAKK